MMRRIQAVVGDMVHDAKILHYSVTFMPSQIKKRSEMGILIPIRSQPKSYVYASYFAVGSILL